ncbi:MAG: hypothetical protein PWP38_1921 [Clostridiales bacterium]|jgi:hypothetical protein|nr:hypothetical protein [Clostridiales bacterium]
MHKQYKAIITDPETIFEDAFKKQSEQQKLR